MLKAIFPLHVDSSKFPGSGQSQRSSTHNDFSRCQNGKDAGMIEGTKSRWGTAEVPQVRNS
jgi:hypothetical protein